jgi:branched-chain amino acid aminotransferase
MNKELIYYNGQWVAKSELENSIPAETNRIYEVLRVINSKPLFLEYHFSRFKKSLREINLESPVSFAECKKILLDTLAKNNLSVCNIRFEGILLNAKLLFAAFPVPFRYPSYEQYMQGVALGSFQTERSNPHVKQSDVNNKIRDQITKLYKKDPLFEILLIDHFGHVTEGSRSNVFFVKKDTLFSPPGENILEGITRKKVIELSDSLGIPYVETDIPFKSMNAYNACFITGTSPKILPVAQINHHRFDVQIPLVRHLMAAYDRLINDYCGKA